MSAPAPGPERAARAVVAATGAARDLGLTVTDPAVLYDVFSVVVHLAPAAVVARVPTVLPRTVREDPAAQAAQQRAELAMAGWLAERGPPRRAAGSGRAPRAGPAGRVLHDLLAVRRAAPPGRPRRPRAVRAHRPPARRDAGPPRGAGVPGALGDAVPDGLAELAHRPDLLDPADLARARTEWALLQPLLTTPVALPAAFPGTDLQPVHGDAPFYNVIPTADGELVGDFEHVSLGPVEWDLVSVGPGGDGGLRRGGGAARAATAGPAAAAVRESARMLQTVAALALTPQLPMLAEALQPVLAQWRDMPPAGGLHLPG
jgi:hypothetical protein